MGDYTDPTRVFFEQQQPEQPDQGDQAEPGDTVNDGADELDVAGSSIPTVQEWIEAHPDMVGEVLQVEQARGPDARKSLVSWLQTRPA